MIILKIYQLILSPIINSLTGMNGACRYSPTCSIYFEEACMRYGIFKGTIMGIKRIARCHPWSAGGYDPINV